MSEIKCCWHRPGNSECRHVAVYQLCAMHPKDHRLFRDVCEIHVVAALDDMLCNFSQVTITFIC
jgi:hypothetical protein